MKEFVRIAVVFPALFVHASAFAAEPKIDKETCIQLKAEQMKFVETGILADIKRGPEQAKANLGPDRIREIELYFSLDEQLKFGCREITLTIDAQRASEEAKRLELNPDADPNAPPEKPATPGETTKPGEAGQGAAAKTSGSPDAEKADTKPAAKPAANARRAPAPQPKADDAYKPTEGAGSTLDDQAESAADGDGEPSSRTDVP